VGFTLRLRRAGPEGELIASRRVEGAGDNAWAYLTADVPQPAGRYYLELAEPAGVVTWWTDPDASAGGPLCVDGLPAGSGARCLEVRQFYTRTARWELELAGPALRGRALLAEGPRQAVPPPPVTLVTPWRRDGYAVDAAAGVPFGRFYSDSSQYVPAHQLKRRSEWGLGLSGAQWIMAGGTGNCDLRWSQPRVHLTGTMTADAMALAFSGSGADWRLEVAPAAAALPEAFPAFFSSDPDQDRLLNGLLYDRNFSWPAGGTGADWKEWMGLARDWTGTPLADGERATLLAIGQEPDGYVHSWGDGPGWPFPDPARYDTRHFTTNSLYVLGAYRWYTWTGDRGFLETMLPRLRRAMDWHRSLAGPDGLLVLPGPTHDGTPQSLGSNYWDISSYGHLDAYANLYFCAALGVMAELEGHVGNPAAHRALRRWQARARAAYRRRFWNPREGRFVQCIDATGAVQDYGATYLNLEAVAYGLATRQQAAAVFSWLDGGRSYRRPEVLVRPPAGDGGLAVPAAGSVAVAFETAAPVETVGALVRGGPGSGADVTFRLRDGGGSVLAERRLAVWWESGWATLTPPRPLEPGRYVLEAADAGGPVRWAETRAAGAGATLRDGTPDPGAPPLALAAVGPAVPGPRDIYDAFQFAPRATTVENRLWYPWVWNALGTPFGAQLQDGGTDLYIAGYDLMARAAHQSPEAAHDRLRALLARYAQPDHLCGGAPLSDGSIPQGDAPGQVGLDVPFPESGLAPAAFLYAFLGVQATTAGLRVAPRLPEALGHAGVRGLCYRGRRLTLEVWHDRVRLRGAGVDLERGYRRGQTLLLLPGPAAP
jgi:hypothetical protein